MTEKTTPATPSGPSPLNLKDLQLHLVQRSEEPRFLALMQAHHDLGALPKIGETLWYVVTSLGEWGALLSFSAGGLEMRGAGSLDWLGLPPPV